MSPSPLAVKPVCLPSTCEAALLERFLKAEAMALWAVRAAQLQPLPANVRTFLQRHELDERDHLARFETILGHRSHERLHLPSVPRQWPALAVQLYGYELLGLEFATLLAGLRPDMIVIVTDEETHVGFFEREIHTILACGTKGADQAKLSARAWWRKLPRTLDRYLEAEVLAPFRTLLTQNVLASLARRLADTGLLEPSIWRRHLPSKETV